MVFITKAFRSICAIFICIQKKIRCIFDKECLEYGIFSDQFDKYFVFALDITVTH